jgi:cytochrome c-type biogenesis protein CcmH
MKRRIASFAFLLILAGLCLPQTGTQYVTPEIRRVGDKLACKCGSCNNTVGTCQMLQCHYTSPAREKIATMQKAGMSDQAIVDAFVKEMGIAALAVPPAEGFHLLGWVMPFIAIGLGLVLIYAYVKRFRKPAPAAATAEPEIDEAYRKRIEKELADLDR